MDELTGIVVHRENDRVVLKLYDPVMCILGEIRLGILESIELAQKILMATTVVEVKEEKIEETIN